jgi:tripartite-type tricarboxylate transporter receptor subunit TctC
MPEEQFINEMKTDLETKEENQMLINVHRFSTSAAFGTIMILAGMASALGAVSFEGKRIEIIVPASEGGGTDVWTRTFAPLLTKELPGNPTIVIRNIKGGSSTKGANEFQVRAKPNGENLLAMAGSTIIGHLFRDKRVKFKLNEWIPLISSPQGTVVYGNPNLGIKGPNDIAKLKGQKLIYGSRAATGTDLPLLLGFHMLGIDIKPVFGVRGRGEGRLGFERGEFNIDRQTTSAYQANVVPLVDKGRAVPLFSFGIFDAKGALKRDPNFADVPHFGETYRLIHGKDPSGPAWDAWKTFVAAGYSVSKALVLPKGTSSEIVDTYVQAIQRIMADPASSKKITDRIGNYQLGIGDNAGAFVKRASTISPETDEWIRNWLVKNYEVKF